MNNLKELPKDWKWVELQDISEITSSRRIFQSDYVQEGVPFYRTKEIKELSEGKNIKIELFISTEKYDAIREKNPVPKIGDILLSAVGTIGVSYIIKNEDCFYFKDGNLIWVRNLKNVNAKYLDYNFAHFIKFQQSILTSGSAYNALTIVKLKKYLVPLPPLSTQQAIVSKIEELFSELDKGVENLKTAQQQLKVYRQAVLTTLINNENLLSIDNIINKLDQGWSPKCLNEQSLDDNEWAVIKTSAIQHGYFQSFENKILPHDLIPKEQHELLPGDILITRAGPRVRVGVCCLIRRTRKRLINCDKVYRIKVNHKKIKPEYLELILNTPHYQRIIENMKSGISDSGLNISQNKFLRVEIPVPSLDKQGSLINEIESKLSVADKMEESIQQSLLQAESLRQSILKKAFEGGLVK
jgi:type I restriction enzyme S subunit